MALQETNTPFLPRGCFRRQNDEPLEYNLIMLKDVKSIVKLSFIAHYSISHLDLSICETSLKIKDHHKLPSCKKFISTEEDCKKAMIPKRRLLYTLHLDLPRTLEMHLRKVPSPEYKSQLFYDVDSFHLRDIYLPTNFYLDILRHFLEESIKSSNKKVETIRKYLKTIRKFFGDLMKFHPELFSSLLNIIYKECNDSEVVKEVLSAFDFKMWVLSSYYGCNPEILDFFLYQARCCGYVVRGHYSSGDLINFCIIYKKYGIVAVLLKYISGPRFLDSDFRFNTIRPPKRVTSNNRKRGLLKEGLDCPIQTGLLTKEMHFLILQLFDVFSLYKWKGLKALQMLWRSIPDPFITTHDVISVLKEHPNSTFIEDISSFIQDVTGEKVMGGRRWQPRKLKHHCRVAIRRTLSENFQLSTGIDQLQLPPKLKNYLRLVH